MKFSLGNFLAGLTFFLFGLIFAGAGIGIWKSNNDFFKTAKETTAIIEDIQTHHSYDRKKGKSTTSHSVYVCYTINGIQYKDIRLDHYSSSMKEGKKITVYYQEDDPYEVQTKGGGIFLPLLFVLLGTIAAVVGLPLTLSSLSFKERALKKNGIHYNATVTNITQNTNYSVNGRHPYNVECQATNPYTGQIMLFRSKNIFTDLSHYPLSNVSVYVSAKNPRKYYVDVDTALEFAQRNSNIMDVR